MPNNDISIYVPVYNGEKTIERCIYSILNQTLKPKNILAINDCSSDNTLRILKKFEKNIQILNNPKNIGLSFTRNFAINKLKTRFIASIDADVEIEKNWLEILYSCLLKNDATLVGGRMYEKNIQNPFNYWRALRIGQQWGDEDIVNPKFVFGCNNLLDSEKINKKNIYKIEGNYFKTNGEDIEFSKLLKEKKLKTFYSSKGICYHLQDDNAESLSKRYWRYLHYGDGFKQRNFIKTIKHLIRQLKRTLIWSFQDIIKLRFQIVYVNFITFYYFCKIDLEFMKKNK